MFLTEGDDLEPDRGKDRGDLRSGSAVVGEYGDDLGETDRTDQCAIAHDLPYDISTRLIKDESKHRGRIEDVFTHA
jgi:hypothetical protein